MKLHTREPDETHSVCNKHNIGLGSTCCECNKKGDCSEKIYDHPYDELTSKLTHKFTKKNLKAAKAIIQENARLLKEEGIQPLNLQAHSYANWLEVDELIEEKINEIIKKLNTL